MIEFAARARNGDFVLDARVGSGPWTPVTAEKTRLRPAELAIAQDSTSRITVRGRFLAASSSQMDRKATFRLTITMFQGDVKGIHTGHGNGQGGNGQGGNGGGSVLGTGAGNGGLSNTGSPVTVTLIAAAAVLIGSGLALVVAERRRGEEDRG